MGVKENGYRESTIVSRVKLLKGLARKAKLTDPEAIKEIIARLDVTEVRKELLVTVYGGFCKQFNLPFQAPRYRRVERLTFIPLEQEVDQLIAGTGAKTSAYLQVLKETGSRAGEAWRIQWTDVDFQNQTSALPLLRDIVLSSRHRFRIIKNIVVTRIEDKTVSGVIDVLESLVKLAASVPGPVIVAVVELVLGLATLTPPIVLQPVN